MTLKELRDSIRTNDGLLGRCFIGIPSTLRRSVVSSLSKLGYIENYSNSISYESVAKIIFWISFLGSNEHGSWGSAASRIQGEFMEGSQFSDRGGDIENSKESDKNSQYYVLIDRLTFILKELYKVEYIIVSSNGSCLIKFTNGKFEEYGSTAFCLVDSFSTPLQTKCYSYSQELLRKIIEHILPTS